MHHGLTETCRRKFSKDDGNETDAVMQFCWAHLIRDVKFLTTLSDLATRRYGEKLLAEIKNLFRLWHRRSEMSTEKWELAAERAKQAVVHRARHAPQRTEAQNIAERFRNHATYYFTFLHVPGVEPTNNAMEQRMRFLAVDRKITHGTRGERDRRWCERMWTVLAPLFPHPFPAMLRSVVKNQISYQFNKNNRLQIMKTPVRFFAGCFALSAIAACAAGTGAGPTAKGETQLAPAIAVEAEEVVYEYTDPKNGSGPFWCFGSSILARNKEDLFVSGIETLFSYTAEEHRKQNYMYHRSVNNIRWLLFRRDADGWKLQQADEKDRTREPSPIGLLADGRLLMSVNPTLDKDTTKASTLNQPAVLEFSTANPKAPARILQPAWEGNPRFNEHSYRTFAVDREHNEFVLFQNIGYTHSEWAFLDNKGQWKAGKLQWPFYKNDSVTPFKAEQNRVNYPSVILRNREVHFFGNSSVNTWSRMQTLDDFKKTGINNPDGLDGRKIGGGGRFRIIHYSWTRDITKAPFAPWLEVNSTFENGGTMSASDMWLGLDGTAHLLWSTSPIALEYRDKYFPDIKRTWGLWYAQIKEGKIILKKPLLETGEGVPKTSQNDLLDNYTISAGRFQVLPGGRLMVIFFISGRDKQGKSRSENRIMEVYQDGTASQSELIPLKYPLSLYFTATPRGGSLPSETIDLVGRPATQSGNNQKAQVRYAKIRCNLGW